MVHIEDARIYYSDDPVHGFNHVLRVLALAERIARAGGADLEIVQAAEFRQKLALLRERMTTAPGQALTQERHAFMEAFFERLAAELRGEA